MPKINLTRYRLKSQPANLTDDDLIAQLCRKSFVPIDDNPTADYSLGWVERFNHLGSGFNPATYRFGGLLAFTLRRDSRKVSPQSIARYLSLAEEEYTEKNGRMPNSLAKKELKETVKAKLLAKAPVTTETVGVAWFPKENEIWLLGRGEGKRGDFERLWALTFGLSLEMIAPFSQALEALPGLAGQLGIAESSSFLDKWDKAKWLGQDFLLWLWAESEMQGNLLTAAGHSLEIQFGGKIVLVNDKEKVTCSGPKENWPEAHTAILEGKSLSKAQIVLATEAMAFSFALDADTLTPSAIKLPKTFLDSGADGTEAGAFLEEVSKVQELLRCLGILFRAFLEVRFGKGETWWESSVVPGIRAWAGRSGQKVLNKVRADLSPEACWQPNKTGESHE